MEIEGIIPTTTIISVIILFVLMIIMILLYLKLRIFLVILVVFLFSLIIGINSMSETNIPFTPYLQTFFLLFQSCIFIITSLKVLTYGKET